MMYPEAGDSTAMSRWTLPVCSRSCDRLRRNTELAQALFGRLQQPAAFLRGHAMRVRARRRLLVLPGQQIFLLGAHQIGAVDGEEPLPLLTYWYVAFAKTF